MTAAPFVELSFDPTGFKPDAIPRAGAFLGTPAEAFEAALAVTRADVVRKAKLELASMGPPTEAQFLRIMDLAWQATFWKYRKVSAPIIADAYLRAYRSANAGDVPSSVIYALADQHAEKVGDYFYTSSREALSEGYNTLVNRRVPAKAAVDRVTEAFGLTPRQMRSYTAATTFDTPVSDRLPRSLKAKATAYIDKAFYGRVKKLAKQEEHNIGEQAKQYAWMWLQDQGRLNDQAEKMWITAKDERVCPVCGPLHGLKININDRFQTVEGEFWTPGLHPNCRCVVRLIENRFSKSLTKKELKEFNELHPRGHRGRFTRVGFTGTLKGMTPEQKKVVRAELAQDKLLSHGSAVGADEEAEAMGRELGMFVVANPADDVSSKKVAPTSAHLKRKPKPAMERNENIVNQTDRLVAAPQGPEKSYPRSGTWATIRRARKAGKPVTIVMPDGTVINKAERWNPKQHPRGGDPENPGRFSRVAHRDRRQFSPSLGLSGPSMFDEPAEKERLEESKPEEREQITLREQIRLGPEKISLGTERISLGREKITLGEPEREKLSLTRENVRLTRDEIEEKLRLSPEEWDERVAEEEQLLLGDEKYQPPPTKTRQLYFKPTVEVHDAAGKRQPYYAVVDEDVINDGERYHLTHQTAFTPGLSSVAADVIEAREQKLRDAIDELGEKQLTLDPPELAGTGDLYTPQLDQSDLIGPLRWLANGAKESEDDFVEVRFKVRGGGDRFERYHYSNFLNMLGPQINNLDLDVTVMRLNEAHDSRIGQTFHKPAGSFRGKESWHTDGSYTVKYETTRKVHDEPENTIRTKVISLDPEGAEERTIPSVFDQE